MPQVVAIALLFGAVVWSQVQVRAANHELGLARYALTNMHHAVHVCGRE